MPSKDALLNKTDAAVCSNKLYGEALVFEHIIFVGQILQEIVSMQQERGE